MTAPLDLWKQAIERGDTNEVGALFVRHPILAEHVNDLIFDFESPAIFRARRNLALVDLLLEHGADINQKTGWGAGGFGILEGIGPDIAGPLIARGAEVDIWAAVSLNDFDRTRQLLEQNPAFVTAPGGDGKHPLHYARNAAMVDLLVGAGADVNARCVDHGSTALQYLIADRDVAFRLLARGAEPDIFMTAYWGSIEHAQRCIAQDPACCNVRLGEGEWTNQGKGDIYKWTIEHDVTPLQVARKRGQTELVDFIIRHASPQTRLIDAIWQGDRALVDEVCKQHPGVVEELIANDPAAIARAAWWYVPDAIAILVELGFDPHRTSVHQSTPLDRAAFHGYADIVANLLRLDPEPPISGTNEFGGTPLAACLHGMNHGWKTGHPQDHAETARLLVEAGSPLSDRLIGMGNQHTDNLIRAKLDGE